MSKYAVFLLALLSLLSLPTRLLANAPMLPASPWYAVVYQPKTGTLHWVNAQGEQGQIARPHLPNEAQYIGLRMSPNGRTLVVIAKLVNGNQALGIYDLTIGAFVAIHEAQPDETIYPGGENIFTASSQYFAIGLYSGDFGNPAWRVILIEAATGNAIAFIDHTYPGVPASSLVAPAVQYIDSTSVHFQLIRMATGASMTYPAFAWRVFGFDAAAPTLAESPYTAADLQYLPLTGIVVMPYKNPNYAAAALEGPGPDANAIGIGLVSDGAPLIAKHVDSTRYHTAARWAKAGEWILFLSNDIDNNRYWNIILGTGTPGNNSHIPFDPQYIDAYGTSDGYLLTKANGELVYNNGFNPTTAPTIATFDASASVIYVTPIGITFMLNQLPGGQPLIVTPPPAIVTSVPPSPAACASAPASRVTVGGMARVALHTNLNLRGQPAGGIVATFTPGTTFYIVAGAVCAEDLYWWQIERNGTFGWVAEALPGEYLIEPYAGPMSPDPVAPPPVVEVPPDAPPPAAPTGCENTLPPRLTIGTSAMVLADSLRPHNGPGGEAIAQRWYLAGTGVMVTAGPECTGGQYWWLVTGEVKIGRIGNRTESVQGWVVEGGNGAYNLAP